ncbi:phage major capsid protein [Agromyces sp. NPDC127015]|uniref:phage major capsid protein n=1 Tax=Agromyces sp. NPDC127015 TaxID=3347108 RepID=UPI003663E0B0
MANDNLTTFGGLQGGATPNLVPKPIATEILKRAEEESVVKKLSGQTAMPLTGSAIAVQTGHIQAGVVGEGEAKPVGKTSYATKSIKPIKVAAIAVVSTELVRTNPAGIWDNIQGDVSSAIARAFDLAVLYGKSAKTGAAIAGVEYVNQTTKRVELGTATKANGGLSSDLIAGYNLVVEGSQVHNGFTGFAADPQFRGQLLSAVDLQGRPIYQQTVDLKAGLDNVLGLPTAYGRAVSSRVGSIADSKVRAFGGDWGALKYGFAQDITVSLSNQATVVDGADTYHLWQQNMVAVLAEATFGWIISDKDSFVAYDDAVA